MIILLVKVGYFKVRKLYSVCYERAREWKRLRKKLLDSEHIIGL